jgi:hypothetical protein
VMMMMMMRVIVKWYLGPFIGIFVFNQARGICGFLNYITLFLYRYILFQCSVI